MTLIDFTNILISTGIISVLSLIGLVTVSFRDEFLRKILIFLISLSAGALIGGAFFHLIPESIESLEAFPNLAVSLVLVGYASFFIFEKILHWNHCHRCSSQFHRRSYYCRCFCYIFPIGKRYHRRNGLAWNTPRNRGFWDTPSQRYG